MAAAVTYLNEITAGDVLEKYPLHFHVWTNNAEKLEESLASKLYDENLTDPHGRTPLLLAIALGFSEAIVILLQHGCDASATDKQGWSATHEAVSTGDPDLISMVIQHREYQKLTEKTGGVTHILEALEEADDFYVEMKWEFSSWIPLLSRVCPSDSYKIYKSGATVRVDTTLKGFDQMNWQRGNQSFIFRGGSKCSEVFEIDHDKKCYWKEKIGLRDESITLNSLQAPPSVISSRLNTPNTTIILDHDNISFTRQKSGILGWGGDKVDSVNGYEAKVYSVSGVELITRTRTEHLSEEDRLRIEEEKKKSQSQMSSVLNFLNQGEKEEIISEEGIADKESCNPYNMTLEEYFNPKSHPGKDIGKLRKMTSRTQKFSATVALSDTFPLNLQEQVLPVINLMANSSSHFAKLRDFITLQLPAGFPVKIEIPLFHVLNARITFQNINGVDKCPEGVVILGEDTNSEAGSATTENNMKSKCIIDKSIFEVHRNYKDYGADVSVYRNTDDTVHDEEDELLQLAIQQSLLEDPSAEQQQASDETSTAQSWLVSQNDVDDEDEQLRRILRESLSTAGLDGNVDNTELDTDTPPAADPLESLSEEDQLDMVMQLSMQEDAEVERRRKEEEEEMAMILALSLTDK